MKRDAHGPVCTSVLVAVGAVIAIAACSGVGSASTPAASAPAAATPSASIPAMPAPAQVSLDHSTTALLMLDLTSVVCTPRRSCVATMPAITTLMTRAREAGVANVYSDTPTAGSSIRQEIAPRAGDAKVTGRADKFFNTELDQLLKQRGVKTIVITGTAANGAVLYTSFGANLRGYTVVVAEDGISSDDPFAVLLTRYQLLNQPGFSNPQNRPLQPNAVTLSRTDLIGFK